MLKNDGKDVKRYFKEMLQVVRKELNRLSIAFFLSDFFFPDHLRRRLLDILKQFEETLLVEAGHAYAKHSTEYLQAEEYSIAR